MGSADTTLTPAQAKVLATIRAEFPLRGHEVHDLADARWGLTKHCPSLAHLEAAARQILRVFG
jgi:hypothetical protein